MQGSNAVRAVLVLGGAYLLVKIFQWIATYSQRASFIRKNGCKPPKKYPLRDPILGLDVFLENVKLSNNGGYLARARERFNELEAKTFSIIMLGRTITHTCEPDNVKAILATNFKDFDMPPTRKAALNPIFGHGIFTTDGPEWEASRALLRPSFTRSQVGDIATFEEHISKLLARIPKDGSTVDLQDLFFELTLDSATDFLFGHSTNVLDKSDPSKRGERFAEAFEAVTIKAGLEYVHFRFLSIRTSLANHIQSEAELVYLPNSSRINPSTPTRKTRHSSITTSKATSPPP